MSDDVSSNGDEAAANEESVADAGDAGAAAPSVADDKPVETMAEEVEGAKEAPDEIKEAAPVHLPLESVAELVEKSVEANEPAPQPEPEPEPESNHPKKTGWWQRRSFF